MKRSENVGLMLMGGAVFAANVAAKTAPPISIRPTFSERFMRRLEPKQGKIRLGGCAEIPRRR